MFGKVNNPYEEVVAKATDEKQTEVNWDILLTVWDKVTEDGEAGARNCVAALQKRLQHRSANVQLFSLTLAGALVNNCGPPLHREISGRAFTQNLVRLVNDRTTHDSVKKEILRLIEEWVKEFGSKPEFDLMVETYETLKKQNHKFTADRPRTPPINHRSEDAMRREEEELQRALAESAQMADPRRGYVASQPPSGSKALPQHPPQSNSYGGGEESGFRPPSRSSAIPPPRPAAAEGRPKRVRAIYDFEGGQGPDELPFVKGDVIVVVETVYADWWRGELRGRSGIFPANRVEELPEEPPRSASAVPTPSSDAEMEAELFAKSASIDQLLTLMKNSSARGENLADNDELADRYNECMALAPKVVNLIRKYDQKQAELREMNDKFNKAKSTYEQMAGYVDPSRGYPTQDYRQGAPPQHQQPYQHPTAQQHGYYPQQQQQQPPPQQQLQPPHVDPEQERREHEERERREYEAKYAEYERELAAYNAAQAAQAAQQQQFYAQQHAQPGQPPAGQPGADPATQQWQASQPSAQQPPQEQYQQQQQQGPPPTATDPRQGQSPPPGATQQWASVQAAQAQTAPPAGEPVWDGQGWVYPQQQQQPVASPPPPQQVASPPPAAGYPAPAGSQAYPAQPYADAQQQQQQQPYALVPSPVGSLGAPPPGVGLAEQMQRLSMEAPAPSVSPSLARHQLYDRPLSASGVAPAPAAAAAVVTSPAPQAQSPNAAYATLPQQQQMYTPTVAAASAQAQPQQSEEEAAAAAEAWARYHQEKAEYDAYMASQAALGGAGQGVGA